jgi:hypothetical protein
MKKGISHTKKIIEMHMIIREYLENLYFNKSENLKEKYKYLVVFDLIKLTQDDTNYLNRSITKI